MFVGHFGLAAAVKATQPRVPLWSLMLATQFLDVVFVVLYLAGGIESFHAVAPGTYGEALIDASYTHSLLGALLLSALYGGLAAWRWGRRAGWVLGAERDYLGAKLQAIWEDQRAFNLLLRQPPKSDEELTDQARDFVLWTESELHELLRVLPWKKHRRLPMRNNHAHLEEEGVDVGP